jgi:subtilisin family serine protease
MVLSTMGGNFPGQLIGTAPKASYWLLRSEDGGSEFLIEEYNWVSAAEYADSVGADVINSSLGYTEFNDPIQNHTYSDLDGDTAPATIGADFAASRGILVVNSLGNEGGSPWYYLSVPSDGDSVMGIGAVDPAGNKAGFSSFGPSYDGRVKPNVSAQGSSTYIADVYSTNGFTFGSGTSFSSPILAGMAACLWQANPSQTNMQIKNAIELSGSQANNPDFLLGYGIPDFMMANNILTVIEDPENGNSLTRIYPNPARESFTIILSQEQPAKGRVEVTDISGRLISSNEFEAQPGESPRFGLEPGMRNGIYLVRIVADSFVNTHTLVVQ